MGKQEQLENSEEITLIDFLYKDTNLINSFYSQIFGGDLTALTKSEISADENSNDLTGSIKLVKGSKLTKHLNTENTTKNINPYDSKVIKLLEQFNLEVLPLNDVYNGSIVATKGKLTYRNYNIIDQIFPFIEKNKLVPEFNAPINPNARGKNRNNTLGKAIQDIIKMIPYGLEFSVETTTDETATCIINKEHLTISPDDLFRSYGNIIPSIWTIIGILDVTELNTTDNMTEEFKSIIDGTNSAFASMVLKNNMNVIRPIAIYRKLSV
ncbi:hypothetical protein D9O40_00915 [Clostridium autoethanogenum]|uniref:Uncharacterized protein n=1 Tax=Clostridium autoethanogenum TaxID=84023 RepID=A0A3M0T4M8_9CLOT|nr:hypothetical protein [Clostridium autoethanogenum]RMD04942.1 hypothetical protein D9O40_00915 [Clostridium autoethanogenum]